MAVSNRSQEKPNKSIAARSCNILLRTIHLAAGCMLLGGHSFGAEPGQLEIWLYGTILSGGALALAEAYPDWHWYREARTWMVFAKIPLTAWIAWQWSHRVFILLTILVIGSVGSHMPGKFRHYRPRFWRD